MTYTVHSLFRTIQGEGHHAGSAAIFCRFAGCNLWTGRERDRPSAVCKFCDTEFVGGNKYSAQDLAHEISWMADEGIIVFTGGEPLLQVDAELIDLLPQFQIHVETNGTIKPPEGIHWLTVSPKAEAKLSIDRADEVKIVFPQDMNYEAVRDSIDAYEYFLQPMAGRDGAVEETIAYIMDHPWWRLSLQTHKFVGIQ